MEKPWKMMEEPWKNDGNHVGNVEYIEIWMEWLRYLIA